MDTFTRPLLVLDYDGVLQVPTTEAGWPGELEYRWEWFHFQDETVTMRISWMPALVQAIDDLVGRHGAQIVWLTSWCSGSGAPIRRATELMAMQSAGHIWPRDRGRPLDVWKVDSILEIARASPGIPIAWVDDLAPATLSTEQRAELLAAGVQITVPGTYSGLTAEMIARISDYFTERSGGDQGVPGAD